jgi:hypothetical protein
MRSLQVKLVDPANEARYSDLQVLKSAAGYYVGTIYSDGQYGEPGSRDTDYFPTKKAANVALALLEWLSSASHKYSDQVIIAFFNKHLTELNLNANNVGYRITP